MVRRALRRLSPFRQTSRTEMTMKKNAVCALIGIAGLLFGCCSQEQRQSTRHRATGSMEPSGVAMRTAAMEPSGVAMGTTEMRPRVMSASAGGATERFALRDVQGLWGGRDLWIKGNGKAIVQFVGRAGRVSGGKAARYAFTVPPADMKALRNHLKTQRFFAITTKKRPGVPDEARPIIYVRTGGRAAAKAQWANDKHPQFDAIYQLLLRIAKSGRSGKRLGMSKHDFGWSPAGFPTIQTLIKLADPKAK